MNLTLMAHYAYFAQNVKTTTKKGLPNPDFATPADAENFTEQLGTAMLYLKWGSAIAATFAVVLIGLKIITARAGHSPENAAKALSGLPWIAGGLILTFAAATLVGAFVG